MPQLQVPWGQCQLAFSLPEHWKVQQIAQPELKPAGDDWRDRIAMALHQPVAGLPLGRLLAARRGGRVAIIVEDLTRHSPLSEILQVVLREIEYAQFPKSQVEIVFAAGMHPPMTAAQVREKLGPCADEGIAWRCNPWHDPKQYVRVGRAGRVDLWIDRGVADADLRILISSVSPHLQAGFGGGYKMLLPGCSMLKTVRGLHRFGAFGKPRQLVGLGPDRNAMRAAIDGAGQLIDQRHGTTFALEYLLDANDLPTFIAAGAPMPTHTMLIKQCAVACGVVPNGAADVLITNAHPRDVDLWQCFKCIPNTRWAVRPNGVIICLARCPEGLREMKTMSWPLSPAATRKVVQWLGPSTLCSLVDRLVTHIAGDSSWFLRLATQTIERNPIFMVSPTLVEQGVKFPGISMFATVEEAAAAADVLLGGGPQRVAVYPWGGASYPVAQT
ncbi:MAG: lactate racemase domain-containing protein [Planctomycetaceae bacterium]|nr:lactate racemase domain-containing protein [Planctomycetaceae bacterium]